MDSKSVQFLAKTTSSLFWRDVVSAWVSFIDKYREKNVLEYPIQATHFMQNENLRRKVKTLLTPVLCTSKLL